MGSGDGVVRIIAIASAETGLDRSELPNNIARSLSKSPCDLADNWLSKPRDGEFGVDVGPTSGKDRLDSEDAGGRSGVDAGSMWGRSGADPGSTRDRFGVHLGSMSG